jgi:hypothetical protein
LIETRVAEVTFNVVLPETPLREPVIDADPAPAPEAFPEASTVATELAPELHVTCEVRSCEVPSLKVPMAENCCEVLAAICGLAGESEIELSVAPLTVSVVAELIPPSAAVMVEAPTVSPVALPLALIEAVEGADEFHTTEDVRS